MKSRLACLFLGIIPLISGLGMIQAQSVLVDALSATGNPGSTVQVSVALESAGGTYPAGLQMDLSFSTSALTYVRAAKGSAADAAGKNVSANFTAPGNLRLLVAGLNQTLISDGIVAQVEFQIAANAPVSITPLIVKGVVASTFQGQLIPSTAGSGLIAIGGGITNPSHLYFAQIADGDGYSTSFALVNPGN